MATGPRRILPFLISQAFLLFTSTQALAAAVQGVPATAGDVRAATSAGVRASAEPANHKLIAPVSATAILTTTATLDLPARRNLNINQPSVCVGNSAADLGRISASTTQDAREPQRMRRKP